MGSGETQRIDATAEGQLTQHMIALLLLLLFLFSFIDTHCHAPQFQFTGTGTDRDLMIWLQTYTFPAEMRMASLEFARQVYGRLVRASLAAGTTSVFYYGTIHLASTKALVDTCIELGQRAFVGKVNMDQHAPEGYIETPEQSLKDTEEFIQYVHGLNQTLVKPVITPRFIPTCSVGLLEGLGALAKKYDVWIQSHASESGDQVEFVKSLLPEMGGVEGVPGLEKGRCTAIFDKVGLLSDKCMMAHGTFLNKDEWTIFKQRGVSIAHCPISNSFCSDRYLKLKPLLSNGNKVGLGSDIAGGYQLSILANVRQAVITSKFHTFDIASHPSDAVVIDKSNLRIKSEAALAAEVAAKAAQDNTVNDTTLSYKDAFWLATSGGAESINMAHELGQFKVGYIFDVQHIDVSPAGVGAGARTIHLFPSDSIEDVFQKFINLGDDRHVREVYVQGRPVKTTQTPIDETITQVEVPNANGTEVAASASQ